MLFFILKAMRRAGIKRKRRESQNRSKSDLALEKDIMAADETTGKSTITILERGVVDVAHAFQWL
jgi:hypothetical protein